ncbi:MAG: agmatine deiminase family protein [Flavobacteriales bacterium]|nr:agmatine deiminase family protein [Flavobacteriales bacterium]MCB9192083.1 agmatine deiminase family protein [Flavobacteriales bacterium]
MKNLLTALFVLGVVFNITAQELPHQLTSEERTMDYTPPSAFGFTTPPASEVRTPAEWEEIDGLCVRWTSSWAQTTLRGIVQHAKEEVPVYIVTNQSYIDNIQDHLQNYNITLDNIQFVVEPSNSIWFRDYGQWNVYTDDVDSLLWVDWIYNRPRPLDDVIPVALADMLDIPLYETTDVPYDLVNTGGNFMVDGFGTAFASELILEENDGTGYGISNHSEAAIDQILEDFMGIDRYIKMPTLPYDGIHHIDMHMKLLDEETLLVGEYPSGVADGPQIESNLNYVLNNFNSVFGTDYKVIRIPMPPEGGQYPNQNGDYRTYTNSVFVNNTILVPTYEQQWDTTALRIYREALPGYNVVGIDCNEIITASGAIHCITKAVASDDPLLISHQPIEDQIYAAVDYTVDALIQHADGIAEATLYWTTDTASGYSAVSMNLTNATDHIWSASIPYQQAGAQVFYYVHAEANNGKEQVRPMPAPQGYWNFKVIADPTGISERELAVGMYPNPTLGQIRVDVQMKTDMTYSVVDCFGRLIESGNAVGSFNLNLSEHAAGVYALNLEWEGGTKTMRIQKL